jgi:ribosomal protein S6--L-glutamate ligase
MKAALISLGSVSSKWILKAMRKYFDHVDDLDIRKTEVIISGEALDVLYEGELINSYDCVYAKGSFRYESMLRSITTALYNKTYMPIQPMAFTIGHDKLLTQLDIQKNKIPMPKTYIAPNLSSAKKILENINYPIVMKFPHGTQGKGVMFAESFSSASSLLDALTALKQPFIIQEYIETEGTDTRAIVVGDKVIAAMKRKAIRGEKRANIHAGGIGEACELDRHAKKLAVETAKTVGAEICAVDMLYGPKGPLVIEVNLSPGLQGIVNTTKIDIADKIAKYLYKRTKIIVDKGKEKGTSEIFKELRNEDKLNEIITNLDFRGNKILLPEAVTNITKFNEKDEYSISAERGKLTIKLFKQQNSNDM